MTVIVGQPVKVRVFVTLCAPIVINIRAYNKTQNRVMNSEFLIDVFGIGSS
jgi:hypothetical protein